ncbi:MAG: hypothetical protein RLZZ444_3976 [Pseudomonadota bacterium]|jgi:nucleoside 2-deoxyribosyltransferase
MTMKLYIAGPEVFLPNAREMLKRKAELARQYGFEPLCPGDLEIPKTDSLRQMGLAISEIDEHMMNQSQAVIANLTPFRGIAADPGTVFELGYMCGQGKLVAVYTNVAANHYERVLAYYNGEVAIDDHGHKRGPDGLSLEDFGMIENLMLDGGVERRGGHVAIHAAEPEALYTDLTGFIACLEALAAKVKAMEAARDHGRKVDTLDASNDG